MIKDAEVNISYMTSKEDGVRTNSYIATITVDGEVRAKVLADRPYELFERAHKLVNIHFNLRKLRE